MDTTLDIENMNVFKSIREEAWKEEAKKYTEESIRLDIKDYRDPLDEERGLYRLLYLKWKRLEESVNDEFLEELVGIILQEISENKHSCSGMSTGEYSYES